MRNFSSSNLGGVHGGARNFTTGRPGGSFSSNGGRGGSSFVQRNFHSSHASFNGSSLGHRSNLTSSFNGSRIGGSSFGSGHRPGGQNFAARNFTHGGRGFNGSSFNHTANFNPGKGGNWNGNHWHNGGGNWNHGNWNHNHGNWNNSWWGRNNGWYGYGRRNYWSGYYPFYGGWGYGFPFLGWGLGYAGFGLGYGGWGGYGYGYPYYSGYYGSGYGNYGYGYPSTSYYYADATAPATTLTQPTTDPTASANDFVGLGEDAFRAGQYAEALRDWQHSMVDDPNNGAVVLLMAQAMFALGQFEQAANTTQMAMQMLPESEWGNVVKNYTQLYGNIGDYTNQLRAAEKARDAKPDDGAVRFVLGYHFGYLNYPKQAVRELDKALDIEPRDVGAQKLRDIFAKQAGIPARAPATNPGVNQAPSLGPTPTPPPPAAVPPQPAATSAVGTDA
jgi:tetratricopeptide (TPR) repeat protein